MTVFVLERGVRSAQATYRYTSPPSCGLGTSLSWHGRWLLVSDVGTTAIVDPTGAHPLVDLSEIARRRAGTLPGHSLPTASWA